MRHARGLASSAHGGELVRELRWLNAVAAHLLRDQVAAEDLAQSTVVAALTSPTGPRQSLRPWLRGVLRNVARMEARTESRRRRRERLPEGNEQTDSLDQVYDARETHQELAAAIDRLGEPFRSTLVLYFFDGLRAVDIARRQGVPATTVRSRLKIALDRLRAELARRHGGNDRDWRRALAPLAALHRPTTWPWERAALHLLATAALVAVVGGALVWTSPSSIGRAGHRPRAVASPPASVGPFPSLAHARLAPGWPRSDDDGDEQAPPVQTSTPVPASLRAITSEPRTPVHAEGHPRLIVTEQRLRHLRASVHSPDSPVGEALRLFAARVERDEPGLLGDDRLNYARAHLAQGAAFLFLLTGERRFAQQAFAQLERLYADPGLEPIPHATPAHPLGMATSGVAVALAYDWAFAGLAPGQRAFLAEKLRLAVDAWAHHRHPKIDRWAGSYLAGACRAAELIERLALGEEAVRAPRFVWLKESLAAHLGAAYGSAGLGQGGIDHAATAGLSLIPALLALRGLGDPSLDAATAAAGLWKLPLYAVAPAGQGVRRLPSRLSPASDPGAGWASLLFALVPERRCRRTGIFTIAPGARPRLCRQGSDSRPPASASCGRPCCTPITRPPAIRAGSWGAPSATNARACSCSVAAGKGGTTCWSRSPGTSARPPAAGTLPRHSGCPFSAPAPCSPAHRRASRPTARSVPRASLPSSSAARPATTRPSSPARCWSTGASSFPAAVWARPAGSAPAQEAAW